MAFVLFVGVYDSEPISLGIVVISKLFATYGEYFYGVMLCDKVYNGTYHREPESSVWQSRHLPPGSYYMQRKQSARNMMTHKVCSRQMHIVDVHSRGPSTRHGSLVYQSSGLHVVHGYVSPRKILSGRSQTAVVL